MTNSVTLAVAMLPIVVSPIIPTPLAAIEKASLLCSSLAELAAPSALVLTLLPTFGTAPEGGVTIAGNGVKVTEIEAMVGDVTRVVRVGGLEERGTVMSVAAGVKVPSSEGPSPSTEVLESVRMELEPGSC